MEYKQYLEGFIGNFFCMTMQGEAVKLQYVRPNTKEIVKEYCKGYGGAFAEIVKVHDDFVEISWKNGKKAVPFQALVIDEVK